MIDTGVPRIFKLVVFAVFVRDIPFWRSTHGKSFLDPLLSRIETEREVSMEQCPFPIIILVIVDTTKMFMKIASYIMNSCILSTSRAVLFDRNSTKDFSEICNDVTMA